MLIADFQLTEHFWLHEMASKGVDGPYVVQNIETELFNIAAERFRVWYNRMIAPLSWHRTIIHNDKVGGSKISQHLKGTAIDVGFPDNEFDSYEINKLFHPRQTQFCINVTTAWSWIIKDICEEYADVIKKFNINMNTGIFWYWWGFHIGFGQYDSNRFKDYR